MSGGVLAWIPFLDPVWALRDHWWWLLVPLCLGISMIYKAWRMPRLDRYWRQVAIMTAQLVLGMIALGLTLAVLVEVIIPALPQTR